jgi:hypothetical protein
MEITKNSGGAPGEIEQIHLHEFFTAKEINIFEPILKKVHPLKGAASISTQTS